MMNERRVKSTTEANVHSGSAGSARFQFSRSIGEPVLIVFLILLAYGGSLRGAFVFDDIGEVLDAGPVRSVTGTILWPVAHPTRTVGDLMFLLNRRWGGVSPIGYHGVNLALHGLVALLLLGILRRILGRLCPMGQTVETPGVWALIITALWAVHPLQTQAVSYIVQRHEILASLFYLGTLYAYIRMREGRGVVFWRWTCLVSAILGMASKEIMVTVPLALLAYESLVLRTSWREFRQQAASFWVLLAVTPLVTITLVGLALRIVSVPGGVLSVTATPCRYALTQAGVWVHYLKLIVWPWPLCLDYGWPIVRGMGAEVVLPLMAVGLGLGVTVYGVFRRRAWAFLPLMFGLVLLPTSSFLPLPDAAMEHRVYLASAWVLTGLVCGVGWMLRRLMLPSVRWMKMAGVLFVVGVLGVGIFLTRERNRDYVDPVRLWRGALEVNPTNQRAWFHLGRACRDAGQIEKSRLAMAGLLALGPDYTSTDPVQLAEQARVSVDARRQIRYYALAHTFLGVLDLDQNHPELALVHLRSAVRVHPDPEALYNLAQALYRLGTWGEARAVCQRFLALEPNDVEGWWLWARIAREQGDEGQTSLALGKVLHLSPADPTARYELAWLWVTAKDPASRRPAEALRVARELWAESRGQSPKVRALLETAQKADSKGFNQGME
jgi:tetratricopeptide (TPR) repeat protein